MLGPLMFLLYINDINKNIISSKLGLFADDCVIYKTIYNNDNSITLHYLPVRGRIKEAAREIL